MDNDLKERHKRILECMQTFSDDRILLGAIVMDVNKIAISSIPTLIISDVELNKWS